MRGAVTVNLCFTQGGKKFVSRCGGGPDLAGAAGVRDELYIGMTNWEKIDADQIFQSEKSLIPVATIS